MTIGPMLCHESGLPAEPPGTDWAIPAYQGAADQTLRRAAEIAVQFPPDTRHAYSDLAYQLLGEIVTRASGTPFPQYVREAILQPLGMSATGFRPPPAPLSARCATGYGWRALSDELDPAPAMPPVWAEGGLWSCVEDLGRWVSFQLRAYRDQDARADLGGWLIRLEWEDGKLTIFTPEAAPWRLILAPTADPDVFTIQHGPGLAGDTVSFQRLPDGQVESLFLAHSTWTRLRPVTARA